MKKTHAVTTWVNPPEFTYLEDLRNVSNEQEAQYINQF